MNGNSTEGLVVPVDIVAFCVGQVDAQQATNGFAGTTVVYDQPSGNEAFLGSNVTRSFSDPPWAQTRLEQGVHLHWALPDALTQTTADGGQLNFPAAPNRWLVTRFLIQGATPTTRSWVVESDALSESLPAGQRPVTIPVQTDDSAGQDYRFLGRWQEFDQSWTPQTSALKAATGANLSAVTNGMPHFAAYYPDCRSAFGFCDTLADVQVPGADPAQLMYVVTGWYDDPSNDPLDAAPTLADIQKTYGWTFAGGAGATPSHTLYSGLVQDIAWSPGTTYVYEQPSQLPIQSEAAVGNSPAEALSAYFANKDNPGAPLYEQLLTAFQLGLFDTLTQPQPGQLSQLAESLHDGQFRSLDAGTIYTVVKKDGSAGNGGGQQEVTDLPLPLADALNLLNTYQQQSDFCQRHMDAFRWQLFADWYRIFLAADSQTQNEAFQVAYHRYGAWGGLSDACAAISKNLSAQMTVVEGQLGDDLMLKPGPAPRYYQPGEPVLLLSSPDLRYPARYGGDDQHSDDGYLLCRLTDQLLTQVKANGQALGASQFGGVALPSPNNLPHPDVFDALLFEACLLNTALAAALTNTTDAALKDALQSLLAGGSPAAYEVAAGQPPSPVAVNWWDGNPWLPVFLYWTASVLPLQPTDQSTKLLDYSAQFFTANYEVDPDSGGFITYAPDGGPGSIPIDPATAAYTQLYEGQSLLSPVPAERFERQLSDYLQDNTDATLRTILDQLQQSNVLVQALSGFNDQLLMREQSLQLTVSADDPNYAELTQAVAPVIGDQNSVGPLFNSYFNPIRAGYMKLSMQAVDSFGQKRQINVARPLVCASSLTAYDQKQQPVPSVVYLAPRLAQPSRLLFRWLAADATAYEEMNAHPASSPVCGWLLPNHLDGSLFLYNQQGQPLGTLYLNGDHTKVGWQSAPGNDRTINQSVQTVLQYENPQLLSLAVALQSDAAFFVDFWHALDTVHSSINPNNLSADNLAVLVGRPVALTQAALRLEVEGGPAVNQSWDCFAGGTYVETDNNFTGVEFPVILGDLKLLDDGLVGYFKWAASGGGYNLTTFYTEGADASSQSGVVRPTQTTLLLTATPKVEPSEPPDFADYTQKVLMLVDPRASVHATTGILPTEAIGIPSDMSSDALSTLEMSFLITPILRANTELALPTPQEAGYQFSWVEEVIPSPGAAPEWAVTPEIVDAAGRAVWPYTPQQVTEGWLRMNPVLLEFSLLNAGGHPVAVAGVPNALTLNLVNKKQRAVTFNPGQLAPEGQSDTGSVFYIHFGDLVAQADVPGIEVAAAGWIFQSFTDARYGAYWAATPSQPTGLAPGQVLSMSVNNLIASTTSAQAQVYFDYYNVDGISDGVYVDLLAVQPDQNPG